MIQRAKVQGYKSSKNIVVKLQPLTVIFGPNAAGKSNLFDALALLSRMVTRRTLREAFEEHRGTPIEAFFHGEQGVEELLKQPTAQFSIEVDVELSDAVVRDVEQRIQDMRKGLPESGNGSIPKQRVVERRLRYSLSVEILTDSGHLRVKDERLCAIKSDGSEKQSRVAFVERVGNKLNLRMEGQAHPSYHERGNVAHPGTVSHHQRIDACNRRRLRRTRERRSSASAQVDCRPAQERG